MLLLALIFHSNIFFPLIIPPNFLLHALNAILPPDHHHSLQVPSISCRFARFLVIVGGCNNFL